MHHDLEQTMALLARMPAALDALLRGLPDAWTLRNEGEQTWNASDIIGHLIHGERTDWIPRTRHVLQFGDTRPFEPFDRLGHASERDPSLAGLLDEFARLREENLHELRALHLQPSDLERRGLHPALGAITLSQLSPPGPRTSSATSTSSPASWPTSTARPPAPGPPTSASCSAPATAPDREGNALASKGGGQAILPVPVSGERGTGRIASPPPSERTNQVRDPDQGGSRASLVRVPNLPPQGRDPGPAGSRTSPSRSPCLCRRHASLPGEGPEPARGGSRTSHPRVGTLDRQGPDPPLAGKEVSD